MADCRLIIIQENPPSRGGRTFRATLDGVSVREFSDEGLITMNTTDGWHSLLIEAERGQEKMLRFNIFPQQHVTRIFVTEGIRGAIDARVDPGVRTVPVPQAPPRTTVSAPEPGPRAAAAAPAPRRGIPTGIFVLCLVAAFVAGIGVSVLFYNVIRPPWSGLSFLGNLGAFSFQTEERGEGTDGADGNGLYEITDSAFEYYTNLVGETEYHAFVEITNTGSSNLYLSSCYFDFENDEGHLLQSDNFLYKCPDIIAPGEKGYFYNGTGSAYIDKEVSLENGIHLVPKLTVTETDVEPLDYPLTDVAFRVGDWGVPTVTGRVTNSSTNDESLFSVDVVFYDAEGKALAIAGTTLTNFNVGQTQSFEISAVAISANITADQIADYRVIARAPYYQWS